MSVVESAAPVTVTLPPSKWRRTMRRYGLPEPYEQLKALTRGKGITRESLQQFVAQLAIPEAERQRLLALAPWSYTGMAAELAKRI